MYATTTTIDAADSATVHIKLFTILFPPPHVPSSVHLKISEKLTLVAGRDGGLQNMEILGIVMLRISDPEFGRVRLAIDNHEQRQVQFQVCVWVGGWMGVCGGGMDGWVGGWVWGIICKVYSLVRGHCKQSAPLRGHVMY